MPFRRPLTPQRACRIPLQPVPIAPLTASIAEPGLSADRAAGGDRRHAEPLSQNQPRRWESEASGESCRPADQSSEATETPPASSLPSDLYLPPTPATRHCLVEISCALATCKQSGCLDTPQSRKTCVALQDARARALPQQKHAGAAVLVPPCAALPTPILLRMPDFFINFNASRVDICLIMLISTMSLPDTGHVPSSCNQENPRNVYCQRKIQLVRTHD